MNSEELKTRTKAFALRVIRMYRALPKAYEAQVMGKQLVRCATSVGAQYREACRAKSRADFKSKISGSLQEMEESQYWLELLLESGTLTEEKIGELMQEAKELLAIFAATERTLRTKKTL